jgi:hypothetical protein
MRTNVTEMSFSLATRGSMACVDSGSEVTADFFSSKPCCAELEPTERAMCCVLEKNVGAPTFQEIRRDRLCFSRSA